MNEVHTREVITERTAAYVVMLAILVTIGSCMVWVVSDGLANARKNIGGTSCIVGCSP